MKTKSICLIIIYLGKLPNYFNLWLNSCKYNETINFLLITNDMTKYKYPKNVKVIYSTLENIKFQIQKKFDFTISLETAYKLCDYKPAYGYIFSEYLKNFDFWGHCDLDVIFGNLRKYLPDTLLDKYDKLYKFGHFSIYKNNKEVNNSFMKFKDKKGNFIYKKVYTSNQSFFFDEKGINNMGILNFFNNEKLTLYSERKYTADISVKYDKLVIINEKKINNPSIFEYCVDNNQSKLYAYTKNKYKVIEKKEFMYIHLQKRRMNVFSNNINKFYIIPNCFVDNVEINKFFSKIRENLIFIRKQYIEILIKRFINKLKRTISFT